MHFVQLLKVSFFIVEDTNSSSKEFLFSYDYQMVSWQTWQRIIFAFENLRYITYAECAERSHIYGENKSQLIKVVFKKAVAIFAKLPTSITI